MSLFIDLYQQGQIASATAKAEHAKTETEILRHQITDLQRKSDALTIACQALWELLRPRMDIDDGALLAKMQEIDLRDGRADGKISTALIPCPRCHRQSNGARKNCLYCGEVLPVTHVFGRV
jgi:hypothetical protein